MASRGFLVLFFLFALMVYLPAFLIDFAIHNDYYIWYGDKSEFFKYPELAWLVGAGRALNAMISYIQVSLIETMTGCAVARFVSFLFCVGFSLLFINYLTSRFSTSLLHSTMVAFAVITLPAVQIYVVWLGNFPPAVNVLMAFSAYLLLDKAVPQEKDGRIIAYVALALCVFIASMHVYPPTSLALLLFTYIRILSSDISSWPDTRKIVIRDILFTSFGTATYFVVHKFIILPFLLRKFEPVRVSLQSIMGHWKYKLALTSDLPDKARLFWELSGTSFGGVWHSTFGNPAAWAVFAVIFLSCVFLIYKGRKAAGGSDVLERRRARRWAAQMAFAILVIILLVNSPMLAASGSFVEYRFTFVYSAMVVITLFWVLEKIRLAVKPALSPIVAAIMFCLAVSSGLLAFKNTLNAALNANTELNFVRQKLGAADIYSGVKRIIYIHTPQWSTFIDRDPLHDLKRPGIGVVNAVLTEMGAGDIPVRGYRAYEPFDFFVWDNSTVLIDMNEARLVQGRHKRELRSDFASSSSTGSAPLSAFESQDIEWRATGYPQWIQMAYYKPKAIIGFSIAFFLAEQPKRWKLLASNDEFDWVKLYEHSDSGRTYTLRGKKVPEGWTLFASEKEGWGWFSFAKYPVSYLPEASSDSRRFAVGKTIVLGTSTPYRYYRWVFMQGSSDSFGVKINFSKDPKYLFPFFRISEDTIVVPSESDFELD